MVEIVQTIKQNKSGIRTDPGTALKNVINGEVIYTPPCCEYVLKVKLALLEQFINNPDVVLIPLESRYLTKFVNFLDLNKFFCILILRFTFFDLFYWNFIKN